MANPKSKKLKQKQEANPKSKKLKQKQEAASGSQNLLTFFHMGNSRKRALENDESDVPSQKRSPPSATPSSVTAPMIPPTPSPIPSVTTPPATPSPEPGSPLSQEQRLKMEQKKLEAESKLVAKKFGAEQLGSSWFKALRQEFKKKYMDSLIKFVSEERSKSTVYPPARDVFSWTLACAIEEVKVVILGQDPYHGPGQAHGMCFSVRAGIPPPPSLINIYKELERDVEGFHRPDHGYLMGWARQGVLLLNACLTVRQREPKSHADKGWEKLTDAVTHWLNDHSKHLVFLLWGKDAQKKCSFIDSKKHCILKSVHPSPLSAHRGFIGCQHFSKANKYLREKGRQEIDWNSLPLH